MHTCIRVEENVSRQRGTRAGNIGGTVSIEHTNVNLPYKCNDIVVSWSIWSLKLQDRHHETASCSPGIGEERPQHKYAITRSLLPPRSKNMIVSRRLGLNPEQSTRPWRTENGSSSDSHDVFVVGREPEHATRHLQQLTAKNRDIVPLFAFGCPLEPFRMH